MSAAARAAAVSRSVRVVTTRHAVADGRAEVSEYAILGDAGTEDGELQG